MKQKKKGTLFLMVLLGIIFGCKDSVTAQISSNTKGIHFEEQLTWPQILEKSKEQNKYIFIDAFATWCGPCQKMEREVYTNTAVGDFFNQYFIMVKVQMDSTLKDNEQVKNWYADARKIMNTYHVAAFPTYLFISPKGELVHRGVGFQPADRFIQLGKIALNEDEQIVTQIARYRKGEKNYKKMLELMNYAQQDKNTTLLDSLTKDYLAYLEQVPENEYLTKSNVRFILMVQPLTSQSRLFKIAYSSNKEKIDSVYGGDGESQSIINDVALREEVINKLWINKKLQTSEPDWNYYQDKISKKYPKAEADKIIVHYKRSFYRKAENWPTFAKLVEEDLTNNPPKANQGLNGVFTRLNGRAWDVFLYCPDTLVLKQALAWSERSIELEDNLQYLDTKANLLYKLGRVSEAISLQERAYVKDRENALKAGREYDYKYIGENLEKMKRGEPTWIEPKVGMPAPNNKRGLDSTAIATWPILGNPSKLTDNGKYCSYVIFNQPAGSQTLVIKSLDGKWQRTYIDATGQTFSADNAFSIFLRGKDSLVIATLGKSAEKVISNVNSYRIISYKGKEYLFYTQSQPNTSLICAEVSGKILNTYNGFSQFIISKNNAVVIAKGKLSDSYQLARVDMQNKVAHTLWTGKDPLINTIVSNDGSMLAFILKKQGQPIIYTSSGIDPATELLMQKDSPGDSMQLENITRFSNDNNRLFISLKEKYTEQYSSEKKAVTVIQLHDIQPELMCPNKIETRSYLGVIDVNTKQQIRLEYPNERLSFLDGGPDAYACLSYKVGDVIYEKDWNTDVKNHYFIINCQNSERMSIPIAGYRVSSPNGKKIIGYDTNWQKLLCFDIATQKITNITDRFKDKDISYEDPNAPSGEVKLAMTGWLGGDTILLLYDHYDIWKVNVNNDESPECLTKGEGRKNKIIFRLAKKTGNRVITDAKPFLISAFDEVTKENGFYELTITGNASLKKLRMSDEFFFLPRPSHAGMEPVKAKNANIWLVQRESATEAPNYFSTTNFRDFTALSDIHPQKNYNWYSTELVNFQSLSGRPLQGILYKPAGFDATKKYPLIINYYEEKSDYLNIFMHPDWMGDDINIPWLVNRGYLIFTPDIAFTIGDPGKSAYNAVIGATNALVKRAYIDSLHMGIMGHSFGGYETNYIVTHSNKFAAAFASSAMSELILAPFSTTVENAIHTGFYETGQLRMRKTLWEAPEKYIENSPIFYVDRVTAPLLLMNNQLDYGVPYAQGIELFLAMRRLRKPVWLLSYKGEAHSLIREENKISHTKKVDQFFDHYLKGEPMPDWMKPQADRDAASR